MLEEDAFLNMPSEGMPMTESERAISSSSFFQSIRSLSFVCYRGSEATDNQLQRLIPELSGAGVSVVDLDEYNDFGELPIVPSETLLLAATRETLSLAQGTPMATVGYGALAGKPDAEAERAAERPAYETPGEEEGARAGHTPKQSGREVSSGAVGAEMEHALGSPGRNLLNEGLEESGCERACGITGGALRADLLVEGFDEVDVQLLDRVMKRAQGLPWITVVTGRCILREITLEDLDDLFALYAQPGITDYTEPLYERAAEEQYTRDYIANMYRFYGYGMWLVFSRESGVLIGRAGFSHADLGDEIVLEMGYIVGTPYQRQGYATEICEKLIAFARENLYGFETLNCFVEPGNAASHGLMKKLKFARNGTVELTGKEMVRYLLDLRDGREDNRC